jgi:hypothetical protein
LGPWYVGFEHEWNARLKLLQWSHIEQTNKSAIQEKKIRVLFLAAEDDATLTPARAHGVSRESLLTASSSPEAFTPHRGVPEATGPVSVPSERPAGSKNLGEIKDEAYSPATGGVAAAVSAAATRVSNAMPMSQEDLKAQLEEAKATIARLTTQASEATGLRQRKGDASVDSKSQLSTAPHTQTAPAGGVSVQITALLCLLSFLVAYFLF